MLASPAPTIAKKTNKRRISMSKQPLTLNEMLANLLQEKPDLLFQQQSPIFPRDILVRKCGTVRFCLSLEGESKQESSAPLFVTLRTGWHAIPFTLPS